MEKSLTWHFHRGERLFASYYLADEFELVAVRIHADGAPTSDLEVDILDEGVSIFADHSGMLPYPGTAAPFYRQTPNTWATLLAGETEELDAEDFRKEDIGPGWVTLKIGSDGGASNVTVQLDLERVSDDGEVSE
jgi:hypothetical protein